MGTNKANKDIIKEPVLWDEFKDFIIGKENSDIILKGISLKLIVNEIDMIKDRLDKLERKDNHDNI